MFNFQPSYTKDWLIDYHRKVYKYAYKQKYLISLYIFSICLLNSQNPADKNFICVSQNTAQKSFSASSTLTENQNKIDITYYKIDIDIDFQSEQISGSVMVNGFVDEDQPDSIELDFSNQMSVDSIIFNNQELEFSHGDNMIKIFAPYVDVEEYYFSFEIFYSGSPSPGSFNFDEHLDVPHIWTLSEPYGSREWWPCKDDPSDKADSADIFITVPEDQIVVSNGSLIQVLDIDGNKKQYHWSERYPICTYLISVTTYPYTVWYDQYIGLEGDTLPLEYYVYPDHYEIVQNNYSLTKDMMQVFAEKFGEYPFMGEKYGHVEFGRGGGMEHQTISSLGGYSQWLIAHELGHQWWGDLVTCASFHHIWLNEGFARYCEALWEEAHNGRDAYVEYWQNHAYYGPGTIYVEEPNTTSEIFNVNLTYNKAGWVVHMLRGVLGDSLFYQSLRSYGYNDSLAYGAVTTENFHAVCEDVSNLALSQFFQQWIYGEYYPRYSVSWLMNNSNELIVTINQTQGWQFFHMPIDLKVFLPNDTLFFTVNDNGYEREFNLGTLSSNPYSVQLDPDNWILKEVQYLNVDSILPSTNQITVFPAYPNPFNPQIFFQFFVPEQMGELKSEIRIYDLTGKIVGEINSNIIRPGINKTIWNSKGNSSGTYFVQLEAEKKLYTQKIQLVK